MRVLVLIFVLLVSPSRAYSIASIPSAAVLHDQRADQRDEEDLQAQKEMATWAWWMLVITAISTGVGTVGLIFLWLSLRQTRQAIKIAAETNDQAERRMRVEIRPWLEVREVKIERIDVWSSPDEPTEQTLFLDATYSIRNAGSIPALYVTTIEQVIMEPGSKIRHQLESKHSENPAGLAHIPAQSEMRHDVKIAYNYDRKKIEASGSTFLRLEIGLCYGDRHQLSGYTTVAHTSAQHAGGYITPKSAVANWNITGVNTKHHVLE